MLMEGWDKTPSDKMASSKIVVILGAGPGLGFSCARLFAKQGHPVALLSRTLSRLEDLASKINQEVGDEHRARPYAVDVSQRPQLDEVFQRIQKDWEGKATLNTAIHNAGGNFMMKPFLETSVEDVTTSFHSQT